MDIQNTPRDWQGAQWGRKHAGKRSGDLLWLCHDSDVKVVEIPRQHSHFSRPYLKQYKVVNFPRESCVSEYNNSHFDGFSILFHPPLAFS